MPQGRQLLSRETQMFTGLERYLLTSQGLHIQRDVRPTNSTMFPPWLAWKILSWGDWQWLRMAWYLVPSQPEILGNLKTTLSDSRVQLKPRASIRSFWKEISKFTLDSVTNDRQNLSWHHHWIWNHRKMSHLDFYTTASYSVVFPHWLVSLLSSHSPYACPFQPFLF
jgi:hypothetical protein